MPDQPKRSLIDTLMQYAMMAAPTMNQAPDFSQLQDPTGGLNKLHQIISGTPRPTPVAPQVGEKVRDFIGGGAKITPDDPAGINAYNRGEGGLPGMGLMTGLTFDAHRQGSPVYHGTTQPFEHFDPKLYNTSDILGTMTHFSETPDYANDWSEGRGKTQFPVKRPNVIAAKVGAKNTLDLIQPNLQDINTALAGVDPEARKFIIHHANEYKDPLDENALLNNISYSLRDRFSFRPEEFAKTPFDAIRYKDIGMPSWAVPHTTPIESHYGGAPLTPPVQRKPTFLAGPEGITPLEQEVLKREPRKSSAYQPIKSTADFDKEANDAWAKHNANPINPLANLFTDWERKQSQYGPKSTVASPDLDTWKAQMNKKMQDLAAEHGITLNPEAPAKPNDWIDQAKAAGTLSPLASADDDIVF